MASSAMEVSVIVNEEKSEKEMLLNKVALLERQCMELQETNDHLEDLNHALIEKERVYREELLGIHKELVERLRNIQSPAFGVKLMGDMDFETFFWRSYGEVPPAAEKLFFTWENKLRDPLWYPFRIVEVGEGKYQEVLKEDDQLLMDLKNVGGERLFNCVVTALREINEYNPSGRYLVSELWNLNENRKASPKEVISYMFRQGAH